MTQSQLTRAIRQALREGPSTEESERNDAIVVVAVDLSLSILCALTLGQFALRLGLESAIGNTVDYWTAVFCAYWIEKYAVRIIVACWLLQLSGVHFPLFHVN